MLVRVFVVLLSPREDPLHCLGVREVAVSDEGLGVAGDVKAIELAELLVHLVFGLVEVDWDDTGTSGLQKLNMRCLNELLSWERTDDVVGMHSLVLSFFEYLILYPSKLLVPLAMALNRLS